ncbi:MAG: hypothetical protein ACJ0HN_05325 [Alphaproteobacteria bacterium]
MNDTAIVAHHQISAAPALGPGKFTFITLAPKMIEYIFSIIARNALEWRTKPLAKEQCFASGFEVELGHRVQRSVRVINISYIFDR